MKRILILWCLLFAAVRIATAKGQLTLCKGGRSGYSIVVPAQADTVETKAAAEFQRLFALSTGIKLPIRDDRTSATAREILIGRVARADTALTAPLGEDGFTIRTAAQRLVITGGTDRGVLYGVYTFFDKYLGYRCYTPTLFKYPHFKQLRIASNLNDTQVPALSYRNVYYAATADPFFADWHKLDHLRPDWGLWAHSFYRLVPPDRYFKEHPDYFALVEGRRTAQQANGKPAQLCLTSDSCFETLCANLKRLMARQPQARYWSVAQNSASPTEPYNCTCPACAALDSTAGSASGSMLHFVNRVAARFPNSTISTLAYHHTRKAPSGIVPAANVNIMICANDCAHHTPIEHDTASTSFRNDFAAWSQLTHNIFVWDYVISFPNLMGPYPNLRTLQPNIRYYIQQGAKGVFEQGNDQPEGEFCELRAYLLARLLWNPDVDLQSELNDFLRGYYEEAAPYIGQYIERMHDELEHSDIPLTTYGRPADHADGFLRPKATEVYEKLFDQAEAAVASKPEVAERVRTARMALTYALADIAQVRGTKESRVYEQTSTGAWRIRPDMLQRLNAFVAYCKTNNIKLTESGFTPDDYLKRTTIRLQRFIKTK